MVSAADMHPEVHAGVGVAEFSRCRKSHETAPDTLLMGSGTGLQMYNRKYVQ